MPLDGKIIVGFFMLAMACVFGGIGITMFRNSIRRRAKGIATTGIVVGQTVRSHGGPASVKYSPEVEFQTQSGERIVFSASFSDPDPPRIGCKVKVRYLPENPKDADVDAALTSWFAPCLLIFFGVAFLWLFVVICFFT